MNQTSTNGDNYANHALIAVAAGNEADEDSNTSYAGAGTAIADWWLTLGPAPMPLSQFAADVSLWNSNPNFPSFAATTAQVNVLKALEAKSQFQPYQNNTLIVGALEPPLGGTDSPPSTGAFPKLDTWLTAQTATSFSDVFRSGDPSIFAVGRNVLVSCPPEAGCTSPEFEDGTSFATPLVSGLAALLWSVDSRVSPGLGLTPLYRSPASTTVGLITSTATAGPTGKFGRSIDALAALLSLDQPATVTAATAPVRLAYVDFNGDGVFNASDINDFVSHYFVGGAGGTPRIIANDPATGMPPPPTFDRYDLNGDGYSGIFTTTTFDLDPTGSVQRAAPLLNTASVTLQTGQVLAFDEKNVSDLDVMCFYAYSSGLFDASTDPTGSVRAQLHCGALQIVAQSGVDAAPGLTGTFGSFDSKVSVNNSGAVAFTGRDSTGLSSGFVASAPSVITNVAPGFSGANRVFGGASLNNGSASNVALAAFQDRVSGSPPTFFMRSWNVDGTGFTLVGKSTNTVAGYCGGGSNAGNACQTNNDCPIFFGPVLTGFAQCIIGHGGFNSASFFQDINDSGVVAFPVLVNGSTQTALYAGDTAANLVALDTFPAFVNLTLRPQISNTNDIVYLDDQGNIKRAAYPAATTEILSPASTCSGQSQRPGISGDGVFVAFAGTCGGKTGIWLIGRFGADGNISFPIWDTTKGDATTLAGVFSAFNATTRYGVASVQQADGSYALTIVFAGTRSYTVNGVAKSNVSGVYRMSAVAYRDKSSVHHIDVVSPPKKLIEAGDILNGHTVSLFDLWDPVSRSGGWISFWVSFTDTQSAVIRTN